MGALALLMQLRLIEDLPKETLTAVVASAIAPYGRGGLRAEQRLHAVQGSS